MANTIQDNAEQVRPSSSIVVRRLGLVLPADAKMASETSPAGQVVHIARPPDPTHTRSSSSRKAWQGGSYQEASHPRAYSGIYIYITF